MTRFTGALDPSTRTMQVEIDVPNPKYALQPGMYANVTLEANSRPDALTIPITAIQRSAGHTTVLLVDANRRVKICDVQLGIESPNKAEVLSGLEEGDQVIVGNLGAYQAGELVKPKAAAFTTAEGMQGSE